MELIHVAKQGRHLVLSSPSTTRIHPLKTCVPNHTSWSNDEPKETVQLPAVNSRSTTDPPTTAASDPAPSEQPLGALPCQPAYHRDMISKINLEVQLIIWTLSQNNTDLHQSISLTHKQIVGVSTVNNQALAIQAISRSVAALQTHSALAATTSPPTRGPKVAKTTALASLKNTYVSLASGAPGKPAMPDKEFTKVSHQKNKTSPPLFIPEYTKINRHLIVKTHGLAVNRLTNDPILDTVNKAVTHHHFRFLYACVPEQGNITLEIPPNVSTDTGALFTLQTTTPLKSLNIIVDSIHANSRWTQYVIHDVLSHLGTTTSQYLSTKMAEEINFASGFSLGQPQPWLKSETFLKDHSFGSSIDSFPSKADVLGTTVVNLLNRHCRFELARPSTSSSSQCHRCYGFGNRKERCEQPPKCGLCAAAHTTEFHTCTTAGWPWGIQCNQTPIRCANYPAGPAANHKARDQSCPHHIKIMMHLRPNTSAALA